MNEDFEMPQQSAAAAESEGRFGRDVTIHAIFMRHGEKDAAGKLTDVGREQGAARGAALSPKDAIKAETATVARVMHTIQEVVKGAPHDRKLNLRENTELNFPCSDKFKNDYAAKGEAAGDWFLSFGKEKPDAETVSPEESAEIFAYMVSHYMDMAPRLYSGSEVDWVHGTQQALAESLLQRIMIRDVDGKKVTGFEKMGDIGGTLGYAEGMDFVVKTDEAGTPGIKLDFRGAEYDLDVAKLNELAERYAGKMKDRNEGSGQK
jgi:broad specificity phosphatase PhoE